MLALKVTHAFGDHAVGETITDKTVMKAVQETNPAFVVRVHLTEDEQAAVKATAKVETKSDHKPDTPRA